MSKSVVIDYHSKSDGTLHEIIVDKSVSVKGEKLITINQDDDVIVMDANVARVLALSLEYFANEK